MWKVKIFTLYPQKSDLVIDKVQKSGMIYSIETSAFIYRS